MAESIKSLGFEWGRLKTGTPPRLHRDSIDFDARWHGGLFAEERGDETPVAFSFATARRSTEPDPLLASATRPTAFAISCAAHIDQSPLYNGQIQGIGPRYCPSLEDKIMRFPDRERHQIYLEPEGVDVDEIYVNGFSMSLPREVQEQLVRALPGLEDATDAPPRLRRRVRLRPADGAEVDTGSAPC